jgi:oxalate decarboxylase/phosphoglucose isomerase-like protein (cupin superfamily)
MGTVETDRGGAMTDGMVLQPGEGRRIQGASMILKVGAGQSLAWSAFEAEVTPGFDVGAHLHHAAEELFCILDGELDLLAFEPRVKTAGGWRSWESASGATVVRGGPGCTMFVPVGCPHAFANPASVPARMLFLASPPGHERYLAEIGELISHGPPDPAAIAEIRARHDIQQLTPMVVGPPR